MQWLPEREENEWHPPWNMDIPMVLPPDGSPPITSNPPGGADLHSGRMTAARLAPHLDWGSTATDHPTTFLSHKGRAVPIDRNIASLIDALWQAGYPTLASCEGRNTATETAYVMLSEPVGKSLMEWVQSNEKRLPEGLTRRFELMLQDPTDWHQYMDRHYPLLESVGFDGAGRLFTLAWRFHRQELLDHREQLVALLRET